MLAAKSQTSLDFARLRATFRPWQGITFAMNRRIIRELHAYNGNIKVKPALCEQQSLLAANEEKEWVMSERCIMTLVFLREKRVLPFPNLSRQDNDGENKVTEGCRLRLANKTLFEL